MAHDIYFDKKNNIHGEYDILFNKNAYVEQISPEELRAHPGDFSFGDIITKNEKITHNSKHKTIKKRTAKKHGAAKAMLRIIAACVILLAAYFAAIKIMQHFGIRIENPFSFFSALTN